MTRLLTIVCALLVAYAALSVPVRAGGWATVVFDPLATVAQAGESVSVRFIVRQHGDKPVHTLNDSALVATVVVQPADGKPFEVVATPDADLGYYTAAVVFPTQGLYQLTVVTDRLDTSDMTPLAVMVADAPVAAAPLVAGVTDSSTVSPLIVLAGVGAMLLVGLALARTR